MKALLKKFVVEEEGLETVEYAVMTALIIGGVIAVVGAIALLIQGRFEDVEDALSQ